MCDLVWSDPDERCGWGISPRWVPGFTWFCGLTPAGVVFCLVLFGFVLFCFVLLPCLHFFSFSITVLLLLALCCVVLRCATTTDHTHIHPPIYHPPTHPINHMPYTGARATRSGRTSRSSSTTSTACA